MPTGHGDLSKMKLSGGGIYQIKYKAMKITVELTDNFIEEGELVDSVKRAIVYDVTNTIKALVKEQIEKEIVSVVRDSINTTVAEETRKVIADFTETGMIVVSGKQVNVTDHLRSIFQNSSGWNNPVDQVKVLAEKWAKELKAKYDGAFVTQLVQRINLAGMLKPEVEKLLLEDSPK